MEDFNIGLNACSNSKFLNMSQIFDLTQFVQKPTRVTQASSTRIDHLYSSHLENITNCFVSTLSISDHFPICFTRKINSKVPQNDQNMASYRCFKHLNEVNFLTEFTHDLETSVNDHETIDPDMAVFSSLIIQQSNKHAPILKQTC